MSVGLVDFGNVHGQCGRQCGSTNIMLQNNDRANILKGMATLVITMFYMKDLNKPRILIPFSSKSVEKCGSCVRFNMCKWIKMEAAML